MSFKDLKPCLDPSASESLEIQLVRVIAREILDGRLTPGMALPGARILAKELQISRHVIVAALQEMQLEGWVVRRNRSGTYIAETIPATTPRTWGSLPESKVIPQEPAFDLPSQMKPVSSLGSLGMDLSEGIPDVRLAPKEALAKGYQRALRRHGDDLLGKGESRGNLTLRECLAQHLSQHRGLGAKAENLLITRGATLALMIIASTLLPKGGHIAVEDPGNRSAWEALESMPNVRLHPIPVDEGGLNIETLEGLLVHQKIDLLYLSPQYQIPTTVTLAPDRRRQVLALARKRNFAILEDDPEFEYYGPSGPVLPLASEDPDGRVIHLGSLTHLLAPSLGLGFIAAPKALVDRLARTRQRLEAQGDRVLEWAVADLIRDGDFERHLARARQTYNGRREAFLEQICVELGPTFTLCPPQGGLSCWIQAPADLDLDAWSKACQTESVKFRPGQHYDFHRRPIPYFRLGFGSLDTQESKRILQILHRLLDVSK